MQQQQQQQQQPYAMQQLQQDVYTQSEQVIESMSPGSFFLS